VKVNKLLPCILHLEIRVGIKIFSMIVAQGMSCPGERKGQDDFVKKTEEVVNTEVLGTHDRPTQWYFPVKEHEIDGDKNRLVMGEVRFTNPRVRAIV
jgi:hypothetical protein